MGSGECTDSTTLKTQVQRIFVFERKPYKVFLGVYSKIRKITKPLELQKAEKCLAASGNGSLFIVPRAWEELNHVPPASPKAPQRRRREPPILHSLFILSEVP